MVSLEEDDAEATHTTAIESTADYELTLMAVGRKTLQPPSKRHSSSVSEHPRQNTAGGDAVAGDGRTEEISQQRKLQKKMKRIDSFCDDAVLHNNGLPIAVASTNHLEEEEFPTYTTSTPNLGTISPGVLDSDSTSNEDPRADSSLHSAVFWKQQKQQLLWEKQQQQRHLEAVWDQQQQQLQQQKQAASEVEVPHAPQQRWGTSPSAPEEATPEVTPPTTLAAAKSESQTENNNNCSSNSTHHIMTTPLLEQYCLEQQQEMMKKMMRRTFTRKRRVQQRHDGPGNKCRSLSNRAGAKALLQSAKKGEALMLFGSPRAKAMSPSARSAKPVIDPKDLPPSSDALLLPWQARESWFSLAIDQDANWLPQLHCLVRSDMIELFRQEQTTTQEAPQEQQQRSKQKNECMATTTTEQQQRMQIGIRCRFCAHTAKAFRVPGSTALPMNVVDLYSCCERMWRDHFPSCADVPQSLQERLRRQDDDTPARPFLPLLRYWIYAAMQLGLTDAPDGGVIITREALDRRSTTRLFGG